MYVVLEWKIKCSTSLSFNTNVTFYLLPHTYEKSPSPLSPKHPAAAKLCIHSSSFSIWLYNLSPTHVLLTYTCTTDLHLVLLTYTWFYWPAPVLLNYTSLVLLTYTHTINLHLYYCFTPVVLTYTCTMYCWPTPVLLTYTHTTAIHLYHLPTPVLLPYFRTTPVLYYWATPVLLTYTRTTDLHLYYWPTPILLTHPNVKQQWSVHS